MTLTDLLPQELQTIWKESGYNSPTAIQDRLYPLLSDGQNVLGISPTGSGKTVAYLLPLIQKITKGQGNQLLVVLPSQELAGQVTEIVRTWSKPLELNVQLILGGANVNRQLDRLKKKPEIIVGTPGRVLELIKLKKIKAHMIQSIVLDEVDHLLKTTEFNATKGILKSLKSETQIVAISATGEQVIPHLDDLFKNDLQIVDVTKEDTSKGAMTHGYIVTPVRKRSDVLRRLAHTENFKALVFFKQLSELGVVSERLSFLGIEHQTLASDQHQVERKKAIQLFESGRVPLLLTTDLGARGLDFSDLEYVVQYDLSATTEDYIHRSGRVGRMGKSGTTISLVNDSELRDLKKMYRELDLNGIELFTTHGKISDTREVVQSDTKSNVSEQQAKTSNVKASESVNQTKRTEPKPSANLVAPVEAKVKAKKKKNRTNRQKNKGAKWKQ